MFAGGGRFLSRIGIIWRTTTLWGTNLGFLFSTEMPAYRKWKSSSLHTIPNRGVKQWRKLPYSKKSTSAKFSRKGGSWNFVSSVLWSSGWVYVKFLWSATRFYARVCTNICILKIFMVHSCFDFLISAVCRYWI